MLKDKSQSKSRIKLAIVGVGKIVKDQHLPAIDNTGQFELVATASPHGAVDGVSAFQDIESLVEGVPEIDAVSLCMPPQHRYMAAQFALSQGIDVLLEKPPGATVCEVERLVALAQLHDSSLYTTWHSRHAAGVERAKEWLHDSDIEIESVLMQWKEDVQKWHPDQEWVWQAGGLGVFDPGINGLSILTYILPVAFFVERATLYFPANKSAPIAAEVTYKTSEGAPIRGEFDWRTKDEEQWSIDIMTNKGQLTLSSGGSHLTIGGETVHLPTAPQHGEYQAIYEKFAWVVTQRKNAVDLEPLKLVADSFLISDRITVEAFE